jgi:phage terminase large subunit
MGFIESKLKEWRAIPLQFVQEAFDWSNVPQDGPSEQQIELFSNFNKGPRISIRSGHGTGKDAGTAMLILWFMSTRAYPKVVCTAPTARQLYDILWSELSKWLRMSILKDEFIIQKDKLFHKDHPKEWWCRAVSPSVKATKEEQAETLAGFHGEHLLIVVDETSGVPDPVFIPLEGAMTQIDNHILLIGNMTRNTGYFYESHFHSELSKPWIKLHWDSRKSTNVKPEYVDYMATKYGVDSNIFKIRVIGDPPEEDARTLIPLHWAQQCVGNEIVIAEDEPLYLGVDVARFGEDKSIILPRQGLRIDPWEEFQGMDTISLGGFILQTYSELEAEGIAIDEVGVGAGVTDWLQKLNRSNVFGVNVKRKSSDITRYHMLRDELWIAMREKCMHGVYSFPVGELGEELCNELASPYYSFNAHGGFKVESKRDMKLRGVASPNIADALGLTEYFHNIASKMWPAKKKKLKKKSIQPMGDKLVAKNSQSWMAA